MSQIDVLKFLTGLPTRTGLGHSFDIVTPIDAASGYGQWKHVKNEQGWPWDIRLYDSKYVYDWVTEKDWASGPRAYKKFIQNHSNLQKLTFEDGMIMFPRFVDTISNKFDLDIPPELTNYAMFEDCRQVSAKSLGLVHQRLRGPFLIDHGGDVKSQPTLIHQYYWMNNGVATLEENYYGLGFGWVSWKLQVLDGQTGFYKSVQTTTENTVNPVLVKIDFPCF